MFRHLLVPTDFTEKSLKAVSIAMELVSGKEGAQVSLLHVIEMIEHASYEEFRAFYEKLERLAEKEMEALIRPYADSPIPIRQDVVLGKRVPEILRFAEESAVDLIILSSHKVDKPQRGEGWGTISYKVALLAPCPVLMVK